MVTLVMVRALLLMTTCVFACGDDGNTRPSDAPSPDASIDAPIDAMDECPAPTGPGLTHANSIGSETWTAAESPHRIPNQVTVQSGATLTLEPCAIVELGAGASITVLGSLVADGGATRRVQIRAADAAQPWRWIDAGQLTLRNTTISGGGQVNGLAELSAMIRVRGAQIDVQSVVVQGSASVGMLVVDGARFAPGSSDLRIIESALHPITLEPVALDDLPTGQYTGNTTDAIDVARVPIGTVGQPASVTMRKRDVFYRMGSATDPNPAQSITAGSTLTIEPGVTLKFRSQYRLDVFDGAALVAVGTAAAPIIMTSAANAPAAGDWVGIKFAGIPVPATRIDHVVIEYAGDPATSTVGFSCGTGLADAIATRTMGAIFISSSNIGAPTAFVTNSTIRDSASNGIDRGYRSDVVVDFLPTNTFERINFCTQTHPRSEGNGCPMPIPCPRT